MLLNGISSLNVSLGGGRVFLELLRQPVGLAEKGCDLEHLAGALAIARGYYGRVDVEKKKSTAAICKILAPNILSKSRLQQNESKNIATILKIKTVHYHHCKIVKLENYILRKKYSHGSHCDYGIVRFNLDDKF